MFNLSPNFFHLPSFSFVHSLNYKNHIEKNKLQFIFRVNYIKYSCIIDGKLKWNNHINRLFIIIGKLFYNLKTLKYILDFKHLSTVYIKLVQSLI